MVATLSRGVTDVHKLPLTAHTSRPCLACISWCTVKWYRSTGDLSTVARSSYTSLSCLEIAIFYPLEDICDLCRAVNLTAWHDSSKMAFITELVPWVLGIAISAFICSRASVYVKVRQEVHRNGCLPPPKYAHKDPILGLDMFLDQINAMKRGDTGEIERERFRRYGKIFEANSWGTRCIYTMETTNIQVILARWFDILASSL